MRAGSRVSSNVVAGTDWDARARRPETSRALRSACLSPQAKLAPETETHRQRVWVSPEQCLPSNLLIRNIFDSPWSMLRISA